MKKHSTSFIQPPIMKLLARSHNMTTLELAAYIYKSNLTYIYATQKTQGFLVITAFEDVHVLKQLKLNIWYTVTVSSWCLESCLMLEIDFRCYEAKIEVSEKASSCWKSNPGYLPCTASGLPLNYNWTTTSPHNPLYVLYRWYWNASVTYPAATQYVLLQLR